MVFAESIRWLDVRWGARWTEAGLRRAGFGGEFMYWRWHASWRGWLVLPAIMDRAMLEREARRLAEFVAARRSDRPDEPLHLMGYSCGGFIAVRALELLPDGVSVASAALLAAGFDPRRDLAPAASRVRGKLIVCSSVLDAAIVGLGTTLFGTADRRHTPSVGAVGLTGPQPPNVVEVPWRPALIRLGHLGGHFTAPAPRFIQHRIAPLMEL